MLLFNTMKKVHFYVLGYAAIKCYECEGRNAKCAEEGSDPKENKLVTCSKNENACYTITGSKQ